MADEDNRPKWAKIVSKCFLIDQHVFLAWMGFLAIVNAYTMRICLSVTITQLVVHRNHSSNSTAVCPADDNFGHKPAAHQAGDYDWSQKLQGFILSSFYIGYIITHIPGGILSEKFGAKWVLSLGILSTAIFTALTPVCVIYGGAYGLIALRILMGLGEGTTFPGLSSLLAQWVPASKRGRLGALVLGGGQIGTILGNTVSGYILHYHDWPWVFYVFAVLAVLWFIFFTLFCASDPVSHPFIEPKEKQYLMEQMGHIQRRHSLPPTPWRAILTGAPMLTLVFCQVGHDWGFFMMVTDLPKYMNDVMQFSVKKNGIYSSLPFLLMWLVSVFTGYISDVLISKEKVRVTTSRKFNTAIAATGPAIFMVLASYAGCNRVLVIVYFTICMGFMGCYYAGMKLTPLDLSPNYAGTLMAITNGFAALTGCIVPYIVGLMTPNTTLHEWRLVFWVSFVVLNVTLIPYLIWTSGEVQPWNDG